MSWTSLVSVGQLAENLQNCVLLDCRAVLGDVEAGIVQYQAGHIPGAFHAELERDLSDMQQTGQGRHPWPSAAQFAQKLSAWGITPETQVVAYDADNSMFAARAWWLLRAFGHKQVAVLDGGLAAWQAAGLPLEQEAPESPSPACGGRLGWGEIPLPQAGEGVKPGDFDYSRLFDHQEVIAHLAHGGLLVDARAPERFRGEVEPIDSRAGHVPGAVNRPFTENLAPDGRFKPAEQLFAEFAELLGGRTPSDLVVMCGSGVTACHHLLALSHAGLVGSKLYKGSWSGWISDPERPVATNE